MPPAPPRGAHGALGAPGISLASGPPRRPPPAAVLRTAGQAAARECGRRGTSARQQRARCGTAAYAAERQRGHGHAHEAT
eukprot:4547134-Prymnesium_polylepis.1